MSTVIVDNLTGKTTAKTVTVTVGATATQSLEVGLIKAWVSIDDTNPPTKRNSGVGDSLNISSIGDGGALQFNLNFANSFSNDTYAFAGCAGNRDGSTTGNRSLVNYATPTTSVKRFYCASGGSDEDVTCMLTGGLA
jgi:hypothetical protein